MLKKWYSNNGDNDDSADDGYEGEDDDGDVDEEFTSPSVILFPSMGRTQKQNTTKKGAVG